MIVKKIMEELTFFGGIAFYLFLSLVFLIRKEINYFLVFTSVLIMIYLITIIIRTFYFKPRPKKIKYRNFISKIDASSFPSIHAARITFISIFCIILIIESLFLKILLLALTLSIFYSRIYLKKHDLVDILAGIILGSILSLTLLII